MKSLARLVDSPRKRYRLTIWSVCALACALRLIHAWQVQYSPTGDSNDYLSYARNMFRPGMMDSTTLFPPGYPAFLALIGSVFGRLSLKPILYAQALVDALTILPLAAVTCYLYGSRAAILAAFGYALYNIAIANSGQVLSETLSICLMITSLWLFTRLIRKPGYARAALTAVALAATIHVRTNILPLAFILSAWLAVGPRWIPAPKMPGRGLRIRLGLFLLGLTLALLVPWCVRNSLICKRPTWVANNAGMNLLQGNNPLSDGTWTDIGLFTDEIKAEMRDRSVPSELHAMGQVAKRFIRTHILYEVLFMIPRRVHKLLLVPNVYYPWDFYSTAPNYYTNPFGYYLFVPLLSWGGVAVLGFVGLFIRGRHLPRLVPLSWGVLILPLLLLIPVQHRYRYIADPLMLICGAAALARMMRGARYGVIIRRGVSVFLVICLIGTGVNLLRFSGPNLLRTSACQNRSAQLTQMVTGHLVCDTNSGPIPRVIPLCQMKVNPALAPHLYYSFRFAIASSDMGTQSRPQIVLTYLDAKGTTVTAPAPDTKLLPATVSLNRFQSRGGHFNRALQVPASTREIRMELVVNYRARIVLSDFRVRGPLWYRPRRLAAAPKAP